MYTYSGDNFFFHFKYRTSILRKPKNTQPQKIITKHVSM